MTFGILIFGVIGLVTLSLAVHAWVDWLESRDGLSAKLAAYEKAQAAKAKAA
jgi:hypothetical protein